MISIFFLRSFQLERENCLSVPKARFCFSLLFNGSCLPPAAQSPPSSRRIFAHSGSPGFFRATASASSRYEGSVFAVKGSVITVYELDSLTFDETGRSFVDSVDDDEGRFAFETLTLNSPYVLIEKQEPYDSVGVHVVLGEEKLDTTVKYRAFKTIVDLRKTQSVSVNSLTSAKIPLLREFIADGKTFE